MCTVSAALSAFQSFYRKVNGSFSFSFFPMCFFFWAGSLKIASIQQTVELSDPVSTQVSKTQVLPEYALEINMNSVSQHRGVQLQFYCKVLLLGSQQLEGKLGLTFWSDESKLSHIINNATTRLPKGHNCGKTPNAISSFWHKKQLSALLLNLRAGKDEKMLEHPTELFQEKPAVQRTKLSASRAARRARTWSNSVLH